MKFDLKGLSRKDLEKLRANVDKALGQIASKERKLALEAAKKAAAAHGFSLSELTATKEKPAKAPKKTSATKSVARYANPADASQTWTGKGRQPQWFKDAVAAGADPETMAL